MTTEADILTIFNGLSNIVNYIKNFEKDFNNLRIHETPELTGMLQQTKRLVDDFYAHASNIKELFYTKCILLSTNGIQDTADNMKTKLNEDVNILFDRHSHTVNENCQVCEKDGGTELEAVQNKSHIKLLQDVTNNKCLSENIETHTIFENTATENVSTEGEKDLVADNFSLNTCQVIESPRKCFNDVFAMIEDDLTEYTRKSISNHSDRKSIESKETVSDEQNQILRNDASSTEIEESSSPKQYNEQTAEMTTLDKSIQVTASEEFSEDIVVKQDNLPNDITKNVLKLNEIVSEQEVTVISGIRLQSEKKISGKEDEVSESLEDSEIPKEKSVDKSVRVTASEDIVTEQVNVPNNDNKTITKHVSELVEMVSEQEMGVISDIRLQSEKEIATREDTASECVEDSKNSQEKCDFQMQTEIATRENSREKCDFQMQTEKESNKDGACNINYLKCREENNQNKINIHNLIKVADSKIQNEVEVRSRDKHADNDFKRDVLIIESNDGKIEIDEQTVTDEGSKINEEGTASKSAKNSEMSQAKSNFQIQPEKVTNKNVEENNQNNSIIIIENTGSLNNIVDSRLQTEKNSENKQIVHDHDIAQNMPNTDGNKSKIDVAQVKEINIVSEIVHIHCQKEINENNQLSIKDNCTKDDTEEHDQNYSMDVDEENISDSEAISDGSQDEAEKCETEQTVSTLVAVKNMNNLETDLDKKVHKDADNFEIIQIESDVQCHKENIENYLNHSMSLEEKLPNQLQGEAERCGETRPMVSGLNPVKDMKPREETENQEKQFVEDGVVVENDKHRDIECSLAKGNEQNHSDSIEEGTMHVLDSLHSSKQCEIEHNCSNDGKEESNQNCLNRIEEDDENKSEDTEDIETVQGKENRQLQSEDTTEKCNEDGTSNRNNLNEQNLLKTAEGSKKENNVEDKNSKCLEENDPEKNLHESEIEVGKQQKTVVQEKSGIQNTKELNVAESSTNEIVADIDNDLTEERIEDDIAKENSKRKQSDQIVGEENKNLEIIKKNADNDQTKKNSIDNSGVNVVNIENDSVKTNVKQRKKKKHQSVKDDDLKNNANNKFRKDRKSKKKNKRNTDKLDRKSKKKNKRNTDKLDTQRKHSGTVCSIMNSIITISDDEMDDSFQINESSFSSTMFSEIDRDITNSEFRNVVLDMLVHRDNLRNMMSKTRIGTTDIVTEKARNLNNDAVLVISDDEVDVQENQSNLNNSLNENTIESNTEQIIGNEDKTNTDLNETTLNKECSINNDLAKLDSDSITEYKSDDEFKPKIKLVALDKLIDHNRTNSCMIDSSVIILSSSDEECEPCGKPRSKRKKKMSSDTNRNPNKKIKLDSKNSEKEKESATPQKKRKNSEESKENMKKLRQFRPSKQIKADISDEKENGEKLDMESNSVAQPSNLDPKFECKVVVNCVNMQTMNLTKNLQEDYSDRKLYNKVYVPLPNIDCNELQKLQNHYKNKRK